MASARIRVLAVALIAHPERSAILVSRGHDRLTGEPFERLLGGGVEFGERAADAVRRELLEELGLAILVEELAGVLENLFTFEGKPHHEIIFVFRARFEDPEPYDQELLAGIEDEPVNGHWRELGLEVEPPLYPSGLAELLGRGGTAPDRGRASKG